MRRGGVEILMHYSMGHIAKRTRDRERERKRQEREWGGGGS